MSIEDTARAFSGHRFADARDNIADDVVWSVIGADDIVGREAVTAAFTDMAEALVGTTVEFTRFEAIVGASSVAIDTEATYTDPDGAISLVASCDLYTFAGDAVTGIRSYNIEV